ncbi:hypothetical protein [Sphingobium sp. CCH11-B1]|uniref:hypothetical protein n=1 Tax=Sphingobium sp. CCH11-B1 TaxID=1768781 RepID=UPI00082F1E26|nr:hypothetical protein [Sphingobium sp. CCH11-B1]
MDLSAVRTRIAKMVPYSRRVRPGAADSFPTFVESELKRLDTSSREVVQALQDLNDRLTAINA